jgi:hypothetical protein
MAMATQVHRNEPRSRYDLTVDGEVVGFADWTTDGDGVVDIHHTEVRRELRGRGLGRALVRGTLDDLRARGHKVVPTCPFVARFIREHPDYADLLAA